MATHVLSKWPSQAPIAFDATATSLVKDAQDLIDTTNAVWDSVVKDVGTPDRATFHNTILPLANDENTRRSRERVLRFYASTSPSKELREASNAATWLLSDAEVDLYCRGDMFPLIDAVVNQTESNVTSLDAESKHYLRKLHRKMHINGCSIHDPAVKTAFEQVNKRIPELVRQCSSNLDEDPSGLWLEPHELAGVPEKILASLKKGETGSPHEGQLWVKTKVPHANKVLTSATSPTTRKKIYYAGKNRLPQNITLFRELVLARDSKARMLGYSSWLAYNASGKMVQTPETVTSFLAEIRDRIRAATLADVGELLAIKREIEDPDAKHLFAWDDSFYTRIRTERQQPERSNVSEYFELDNTLAKLLQLYGRLFGTRFERIAPEQQAEMGKLLVWHKDVRMYAVWDADAEDAHQFLGYAYFDLFPRDSKYGHRGCYPLSWGFFQGDGRSEHPSCALVMNFIKPADTSTPVLLSLVDVRRLFHELGHLHHTLCTKTQYSSLGYLDRDFSEAPCLMLERFFWKESYIRDLSHHYSYLSPEFEAVWLAAKSSDQQPRPQPPLTLPDDTVARLAHMNPKQFVPDQVFNLFLSLYDVLVHNPATHEDLENMNLAVEFNKLQADVTGWAGGEAIGDGWEWGQGQSVFRMIVSGYDAGYYTYVLGKAYSLDMWQASGFGIEAESMDEQAGRRFRREILEVGGRQPEMETLVGYLGREPSTRAYFEWLGI